MGGRGQLAALFNLAISLVVGTRLLALWLRSRQLPELCIGAAFLSSGVAGTALVLVARARGSAGAWAAAVAFMNLGAAALAFFAWHVFRREAWSGALALGALLLGLAAGYLGQLLAGGFAEAMRRDAWYWLGFASRMGVYAWMALESLRYHGLMRRRRRLGLAEPLLANRFLLWGIASACVVASGTLGAAEIAAGASARGPTVPLRMTLFAVTALGVWLTFFPPAFYRRRLSERAG